MRSRAVWLIALIVSAVACGWPFDADGGDDAFVGCTAIGCVNAVTFAISGTGLGADGGRVVAEACFDGTCEKTRYTQQPSGASRSTNSQMDVIVEPDSVLVMLRLPQAAYDEDAVHKVSVMLRVDGGAPIRLQRDVDLDRSQPNGPNCEPVCWGARVEHAV